MGPGVRPARPDTRVLLPSPGDGPLQLSLNRPESLLDREPVVVGTFVLDDHLDVPQGLDHQLQITTMGARASPFRGPILMILV